ncbi:MAG: hypothetical protein AAFV59_06755 [Pseudomonadota bacterium]
MKLVTLVSGDYHKAAAALVNSCAANGFTGEFFVFHEEDTIPWHLSSKANVILQKFDDFNGWIANLKPKYIQGLGDGEICFIDADCIVPRPDLFQMLSQFLEAGPVACSESLLPMSDLRLQEWRRAAKGNSTIAEAPKEPISCVPYYNAGFLAISMPRDKPLIDHWAQLVDDLLDEGRVEMFEKAFYLTGDQDCLNAALNSFPDTFSSFGPPDVGFRGLPVNPFLCLGSYNEPILLHCTGKRKSWRPPAAPKTRPDVYDKAYYKYTHEETPWVEIERDLAPKVDGWFRDTKQSRRSVAIRRLVAKFRP